MKSQTDSYFLRGMNGDRKDTSGGTKSVSITLGTNEGDPITDYDDQSGFPYKTVTYDAPGGKAMSRTVSHPWRPQSATQTRPSGTLTAAFTGTLNTWGFTP
ncbi:hypothetical protein [Streptomyces sp. KL116D]|uniref:hypothetical protein n=1 Tax=Streptomyces sp. KL116D TaxID=3045152 RepID=UPI00355844C5